jgi:hypothetical protein
MTAHIRLVSPETLGDGDDSQVPDEHEAEGEDKPIGLPEEEGSSGNDSLGEPLPLIAEREDRPCATEASDSASRSSFRRLIARAWGPKPRAIAADGNAADARTDESSGDAASLGAPAETGETRIVSADAEAGVDDAEPGRAPAKTRRRVYGRKGAIAAALAASVAIPAIAFLNWPHSPPPSAVEPGMLADGQSKLMAPAAALATVPPREAANVPRERPHVVDTRSHELSEMLSFKEGDNSAEPASAAGPPKAMAASPGKAPALTAPAPQVAVLPPAPPSTGEPKPPPITPEARPEVVGEKVQTMAPQKLPEMAEQPQPPASAPAPAAPPKLVAPAVSPREPGMGEVTKLEGRLSALETVLKDRASETQVRVEAEKAETHTLDKIAELGALVVRLTGQVRDLQDRVQTLSTGSDGKFADLTRRIALGEANRSVASAETANESRPASAEYSGAGKASASADRTHMKIGAEVKLNYRIQAASPGLAMLSVIDGSPDDRPVEVAIGTDLPGYGKVRSIEQHGEAWVVKADRGSIQ